jgi:hypothetical protein
LNAASGSSRESGVIDWYAAAGPLCLARLREAHEPKTGLFSRQLRHGQWAGTGAAEAVTSTAICLIALSRGEIDGREIGMQSGRSLDALADSIRAQRYHGAVGLALWANAVNGGVALDVFLNRCGYDKDGLHRLVPTLTTMELAWLLSGLLHEERRGSSGAVAAADEAIAALLVRQGRSGIFAHAGNRAPLSHRLRAHVATFADQIYPVQALACAAIGRNRREARDAAHRCADALLDRRGPLHQWWWHYDPRSGAVSRRYPVYSVHQHGMAPMAFMALATAGAAEYSDRAWPGLEWLRENEMRQPMLDPDAGTIWRDIEPDSGAFERRLRDVSELIGLAAEGQSDVARLRLNRETRPYEWAWCLMAGAQLTTSPPFGHLA